MARAQEAKQRGRWREAATLYEELGQFGEAAECNQAALSSPYTSAADAKVLLDRASQQLWVADQREAAVQLLIEHGQVEKAAQLRERMGDARAAATLLAAHGQVQKAAALLEGIGDLPAAAEVLAKGGEIDAAVALLGSAHPAQAAQLAERQGQPLRAAELYLQAGDPEAAAHLFVQGEDLRRAAGVYQELGDLKTAVSLLERSGAHAEAAALLVRLGDTEQAAKLFAKSNDPLGLARALEQSGDLWEAARAFAKAAAPAETLRVLWLLPPDQRARTEVRLLAGSALIQAGRADRAISLLRPLLTQGLTEAPARCEATYLLGTAYEARGEVTEAKACFQQALAIDPQFRDTTLRLAKLNASPSPPPPRSSPSRPSDLPALPARYQVETKLGEGAMGVVYRAHDQFLNRTVAIKILSRELVANHQARSYFLREAQAAGRLSHPNIVTLFDVGVEDNLPYLVMEYLMGRDLESVGDEGPLDPESVIHYGRQLAEALGAVHAQQIVHRDVKPANVLLVAGTQTIKLMDFGVAHLAQPGMAGRLTIIAGTPDFMAPEQFAGRGLGPWTDIFGLGGTLYLLLTGQVPYPESGPADVLPVPDPRALRPEIPARLAMLLMACLQRAPERRPQSTQPLIEALTSMDRMA